MSPRRSEPDTLVDRGALLYSKGDVQGALQCWKQALAFDPGHCAALTWLDHLEGELGGAGRRTSSVRRSPSGRQPSGGMELPEPPEPTPLPSLAALPELPPLDGGRPGRLPAAPAPRDLRDSRSTSDELPVLEPTLDAFYPSTRAELPVVEVEELEDGALGADDEPMTVASMPAIALPDGEGPGELEAIEGLALDEGLEGDAELEVVEGLEVIDELGDGSEPGSGAAAELELESFGPADEPPAPAAWGAAGGRRGPPGPDLAPRQDDDGYLDLGPLEFADEGSCRPSRDEHATATPVREIALMGGDADEPEELLRAAEHAEQFSDLSSPSPLPLRPPPQGGGSTPPTSGEKRPTLRPRSRFPEPPTGVMFPGPQELPTAPRGGSSIPPPLLEPQGDGAEAEPSFRALPARAGEEPTPRGLVVPLVAEQPETADAPPATGREPSWSRLDSWRNRPAPTWGSEERRAPSRPEERGGTNRWMSSPGPPSQESLRGPVSTERATQPELAVERPTPVARTPAVSSDRSVTPEVDDCLAAARDAMLRDDLDTALHWTKEMLRHDADDPQAIALSNEVRDRLVKRYLHLMGGRNAVVRQKIGRTELLRLQLDHRAGFVLSWVDGRTTVDELLDLSGMDPLETLKLLARLVEQGVLEA